MNFFDFLKLHSDGQTSSDMIMKLSKDELKEIDPFICNRFLATNTKFAAMINQLDKLLLNTGLTKNQYLVFLYHLLPKTYIQLNFPKKDGKKEKKIDMILELIKETNKCNTVMAVQYYTILKNNNLLDNFCKNHGVI